MPNPSDFTYPHTVGLYPGVDTYPAGPVLTGSPDGVDSASVLAASDISRPDPLRWLAVDLLSGQIVCDLPSLVATDPYRRTLGQYESQTVTLYVTDTVDPDWMHGTRPFSAALIAYRGAPGSEVIYWGGIVLRRQRSLGSNAVTLTVATPECYLDRRYTGSYTTDAGLTGATRLQNQIVADLITDFARLDSGLPFTVTQLDTGTTQLYEVYNDYDDKTVYSVLTTLTGLLNGPEWTAHWTWNRSNNTITPAFYVGTRIGTPVTAGLAPVATFDSANLLEGDLDENWSSGMGANKVTATSSGQGLARPTATVAGASLDGRPRVEYRFQPTTSIEDPLTLQQHAQRAFNLLDGGTNTVTLKVAAGTAPFFGVDWGLGDDIGYVIDGPAFPTTVSGVARCVGYETTDTYIAPTLYLPQVI